MVSSFVPLAARQEYCAVSNTPDWEMIRIAHGIAKQRGCNAKVCYLVSRLGHSVYSWAHASSTPTLAPIVVSKPRLVEGHDSSAKCFCPETCHITRSVVFVSHPDTRQRALASVELRLRYAGVLCASGLMLRFCERC